MAQPLEGVLVPHAPLLLPGLVTSDEVEVADAIRSAILEVLDPDAPVVALVSPHARRTCVYAAPGGDLRAFGIDGAVGWEVDAELVTALGHAAGVPVVETVPDHGVVVPLMLLRPDVPVVAVGIGEDVPDPTEQGRALGVALASRLPAGSLVIASGNGAAGLTPRAPLTEVPGAASAQQRFEMALGVDVARAAELAGALPGSCSAGPLAALAAATGPAPLRISCSEAPVGVAYTVARTR